MTKRFALAAAALSVATLLSPLAAQADGLYSGTVTGFFSAPVLTGNLVLIDGSSSFFDNSTTAVTSGFGSDFVTWGANPGFTGLTYSQLIFLGDSFTNVASDQVFHIGTIIFTNGTSALDSLIFGAQLHLLTGVADEHISSLSIVTTQNTGLSDVRDSDFIGFSDFSPTFNVYENQTSSVELYGSIVGDPTLDLDHIEISAVATSAGFIGNGIGAIPEPATWLTMIFGFFGLGAVLRARRGRVSTAAA